MHKNIRFGILFFRMEIVWGIMSRGLKRIFDIRKNLSVSVLSLTYTLLLLFGAGYMQNGNAKFVTDHPVRSTIILVALFIFFRAAILFLFRLLDKYRPKGHHQTSKLQTIYDKHPFMISMLIILLFWLPYIISFYPAILSPDPSFQIRQYFGIPNKYSEYSVMIDPNVTITNHHPVVHTLLLGTALKLGNLAGNDNFGLFLYSIIQISVLSGVLAFTLSYMKKINVSYRYRIAVLLMYGLVPMFPFYAMSAVKDVIFTALFVLYTILIYHLTRNRTADLKAKHLVLIILLLILLLLFRNNGFHIVLLSFPFLILVSKKNLKKLLLVFVLFLAFNYSHNNLILPAFKVTPGSIREMLSIPFQQTARYVKYHSDNLTDEEYAIYDKILDMSDLAERYKPEISDPVKKKYNKYTTNEELKEYFKYWFKDLSKDPGLYVDATINNVYGYFYPPKTSWYIYNTYDTRIVDNGFNYHFNNLEDSRELLSIFGLAFPYFPILGLVSNIGFNTWLLFLLATYFIYKKKVRGIVYLVPSFVVLLVCVASPVNTYFRYAMPYIFCMPTIIALFINYLKGSERDEEKQNSSFNPLLQ